VRNALIEYNLATAALAGVIGVTNVFFDDELIDPSTLAYKQCNNKNHQLLWNRHCPQEFTWVLRGNFHANKGYSNRKYGDILVDFSPIVFHSY